MSSTAALQLLSLVTRYTVPGVSPPSLGSWAVVTGATDGIGKGFAQQLAKQGLNLVLVSRSLDKLTTVAKEIEEKFDVKTKVVDIDFTVDRDAQSRLETETKDLNVGVLINNVGVSYDHPEYFLQIGRRKILNVCRSESRLWSDNGPGKCRDVVECNIMSMMDVTRAVLPGMLARGRGAVLNLSSFLAYGGPLLTVYAASKAFVRQFTEDLDREYRDQGQWRLVRGSIVSMSPPCPGVRVSCVAPYYVASNMSKIRVSSASLTVPSPDTYAASVLGSLGLATSSAGYWPHELITLAIRCVATSTRLSAD